MPKRHPAPSPLSETMTPAEFADACRRHHGTLGKAQKALGVTLSEFAAWEMGLTPVPADVRRALLAVPTPKANDLKSLLKISPAAGAVASAFQRKDEPMRPRAFVLSCRRRHGTLLQAQEALGVSLPDMEAWAAGIAPVPDALRRQLTGANLPRTAHSRPPRAIYGVETPEKFFYTVDSAAAEHGISRETAYARARRGVAGWSLVGMSPPDRPKTPRRKPETLGAIVTPKGTFPSLKEAAAANAVNYTTAYQRIIRPGATSGWYRLEDHQRLFSQQPN